MTIRKMNDLEITAHQLEIEASGAVGKNVVLVRDDGGGVVESHEFPNNAMFKNSVFNFEQEQHNATSRI